MENFCPIRSADAKKAIPCSQECAWYAIDEEQCAVFVMTRELSELIDSVDRIEYQISSNS